MRRQVKITKEDGTSVYGDSWEADGNSTKMALFSPYTEQDFEEVRRAMIKYDFTTKDLKSWSIIAV